LKYLGVRISPTQVKAQAIRFQRDVKTLHDVQALTGTIQWLRGIIPIPLDWMQPLYSLLQGTQPWEP
ncbi:POK6 protein, partial [Ciconia maguari]|nr:POK6 protein [Ciconia maguari]